MALKRQLNSLFFSTGIIAAVFISALNFSSSNFIDKKWMLFFFAALLIFYLELILETYSHLGVVDFRQGLNTTKEKLISILNLLVLPSIFIVSLFLFCLNFKQSYFLIVLLISSIGVVSYWFTSLGVNMEKQAFGNLITHESFDLINLLSFVFATASFTNKVDASNYKYIWLVLFLATLVILIFSIFIKLKISLFRILGISLLASVFMFSIIFTTRFIDFLSFNNHIIWTMYFTVVYFIVVSIIQLNFNKELSKINLFKYLCVLLCLTGIILLLNFYSA